MFQLIFMSGSKRVHLAVGIHLYSGIREKTTRQPEEAMETREKSGNDVMQENLFLVKSGVSF